ncbi:MAG: hypothetical protein VKJ24_00515 [Synechococcales bacterium]|nr:hypothetical protein [Synechococcales bacterium]
MRWVVPVPAIEPEIVQTYRVTKAFYAEVQYRADLDSHCQWYEETARRNRQELQRMKGDINPLRWFRRG